MINKIEIYLLRYVKESSTLKIARKEHLLFNNDRDGIKFKINSFLIKRVSENLITLQRENYLT